MSKSWNTYPIHRRRKTPESVEVKVDIRPGPSTPAMKTAWHKFFTHLIAECWGESKAGSEGKANE